MNNLVIIEDLEGVVEDRFDHSNLPAGVGDVAARVGAHQSRSIARLVR